MSDQIGWLIMQTNGRWAIDYPNSDKAGDSVREEIHSGDMIYVEAPGANAMQLTRIEYDHAKRVFYSVEGIPLKVGARASFGGMRF